MVVLLLRGKYGTFVRDMKRVAKTEDGFTILELLVVIICAIILLAVVVILHS